MKKNCITPPVFFKTFASPLFPIFEMAKKDVQIFFLTRKINAIQFKPGAAFVNPFFSLVSYTLNPYHGRPQTFFQGGQKFYRGGAGPPSGPVINPAIISIS